MSERVERAISFLQRDRTPAERATSIHGYVASIRKHAEKTHRQLGRAIEAWIELVPSELAERTRLTALRRGVLHVDVDDAAARYELDRLLRDGLEDQLRSQFNGTLIRVKLRQGRSST